MTSSQNEDDKKTLSLSSKTLDLKKTLGADQVRQSFSHGRSKIVDVQIKRKRIISKPIHGVRSPDDPNNTAAELGITSAELENKIRLLQDAREHNAMEQQRREQEELKRLQHEAELKQQAEEQQRIELEAQALALKNKIEDSDSEEATFASSTAIETKTDVEPVTHKSHKNPHEKKDNFVDGDDAARAKSKITAKVETKRSTATPVKRESNNRNRFAGPSSEGDEESGLQRYRSIKKPSKKKNKLQIQEVKKITREIIIPEAITVQELSNRMAVRAAEVVKKLMTMGVMMTINQMLDAETAEILCVEFGHTPKKVSMADVEIGLGEADHHEDAMFTRPPVVTVMGHVDHGKTSLLDAIRKSDVVSGEAGGITQHIGAYQVTLSSQQKITFIDTPGHAAFSEMRARGANVTDVVVLVVAADDGIMAQTVEAINHAKAAKVPIIVAINKIDKPEADAARVRQELLMHDIILEEFGGDILSVEVSAKKNLNIDKLLETILLQAEILELKANPDRSAIGVIIESKVERGRGAIATVLMQQGTLRVGEIFVAGAEWGRVKALIDDHGHTLKSVIPAMPAEVLGFSKPPAPGEPFVVVESESRAREIAEFRSHRLKENKATLSRKSTVEQLILNKVEGERSELALIVKSDVQGSVEAIVNSLSKLATDEVAVRILHIGVGGISESDVTLAQASNALIIGFNVRANPQAREAAAKENIQIRYYSIIYDVIDDIKTMLSGMLTPTLKENFLGNAAIRDVFNITKVGKIAGCMVTEGTVKRGAKVRLLRDNIVIHEGTLKTLKRFKDEVKEVKESYECGMAFENYQDIRVGDIIECFDVQHIAREL